MKSRLELVLAFVRDEYGDLLDYQQQEILKVLLDSQKIRGELLDKLSAYEEKEIKREKK